MSRVLFLVTLAAACCQFSRSVSALSDGAEEPGSYKVDPAQDTSSFSVGGAVDYREEDEEDEEETAATSPYLPLLVSAPITLNVREGAEATFPCQVANLGEYVILWKRNENKVLSAGHMRLVKDPRIVFKKDMALQIHGVKVADAGKYTCQVSTEPVMEVTHTLQVLVPPKVYTQPQSGLVVLRKGDPLKIACQAVGNPPPAITWTHDGRKMDIQGEKVTISQVGRADAGVYICTADNKIGNVETGTIQVQVQHAPEVDADTEWVHAGVGGSAELACRVRAEPAARVTWLRENGQPVVDDANSATIRVEGERHVLLLRGLGEDDLPSTFSCVANNTLGEVSKSIVLSGLPTAPAVKSRPAGAKPTSYLMVWSVKSHSPVIEYTLRFRKISATVNGSEWEEVVVPAGTRQSGPTHTASYEISGLEPAERYEAELSARNRYGWGQRSPPFAFATLGAVTTPPSTETNEILPVWAADRRQEDEGVSLGRQGGKQANQGTQCLHTTLLFGALLLLPGLL